MRLLETQTKALDYDSMAIRTQEAIFLEWNYHNIWQAAH